MNGKSFWIVLGAGVAVGAAVALLYAPQSGVVTRKKLRRGIEDAEEYLEDAGDYLKEQADKLSREAQKALKLTRAYADTTVDSAGEFLAGAARTVKHAKSMVS
ncbi:MAG TPA: YtxH domain-containing protein [Granulicella sp.]|jgi:gas vesicle protein|nr:YtxH domain-containing protein [Granulicella sp.]